MTNKKKTLLTGILLGALIVIMVLCLVCCGKKGASDKSANKSDETVVAETDNDVSEDVKTDETEKEDNKVETVKPTDKNDTAASDDAEKKTDSDKKTEEKKDTDKKQADTHAHNWIATYKTVNHPAETKKVWVVEKEAYTEEVPIYESQFVSVCNACGEILSGKGDEYITQHIKSHMLVGEEGGHHKEDRDVLAGYKTINHEEKGHFETKVLKAAYTEKVIAGYKCSCGATK